MAEQPTLQPERVLLGHCPECERVVLVQNNRETWPLVRCACGWVGGTTDVANRTRYERGGYVEDVWGSGVRTVEGT